MGLPLSFVVFAIALVFLFVLVNGISQGITDSNPISSAFVICVFLMGALGLKDPGTGLMVAAILLISTSVGCDMQQVGGKQRLAGLILNITNIPSLGLDIVDGATICTGFYWDANEGTRAFAKRFQAAHPKKMMPNDMHAGIYAATEHLMKAVAQLKSADDGVKVVDTMKAIPTDDPLFGKGIIRVDGRKLHPMYLYKAKTPAEIEIRLGLFPARRHDQTRRRFSPPGQGRVSVRQGMKMQAPHRRDGFSVTEIRPVRLAWR